MNKNAENINDSINRNLKDLGFYKELEIKLDKRGNENKFRLNFASNSDKMATLSDGQKHKLALAVFFASIENDDLDDKIIIFDDPISTLDYKTYHAVRKKIIDLSIEKKPKSIIILTCNVDYLFIQLSNRFNDIESDDIDMFHLTGKSLEKIDYNIINYDDIALYKKGVESIKTAEEFNLVGRLNLRMARLFLDLRLRCDGIVSNENPAIEIDNLPKQSDTEKKKLKELNKVITRNCRNENSTNCDIYETFKCLDEFIKILGFPSLFDDGILDKLKVLSSPFLQKN